MTNSPPRQPLPDREPTGYEAAKWFEDEWSLPARQVDRKRDIYVEPPNTGMQFVAAALDRDMVGHQKLSADMRGAAGDQHYRQALDLSSKLVASEAQIRFLHERLGVATGDDVDRGGGG